MDIPKCVYEIYSILLKFPLWCDVINIIIKLYIRSKYRLLRSDYWKMMTLIHYDDQNEPDKQMIYDYFNRHKDILFSQFAKEININQDKDKPISVYVGELELLNRVVSRIRSLGAVSSNYFFSDHSWIFYSNKIIMVMSYHDHEINIILMPRGRMLHIKEFTFWPKWSLEID